MLGVAMMTAAAVAVTQPAPTAQAAVETAMRASAAGWDAGDLDRFMAVYADDAVYVTAKGVTRGKAAIADSYRPSFANGGNTRGKLTFQTLAYRTLSPVHFLYIARWTLTPASGAAQSGTTSLVFERRKDGWRIISDHSS